MATNDPVLHALVDMVQAVDRHGMIGMVILSGYPSELYEGLFADWSRHEREHMADGGRPRTEVLWINPACSAALDMERKQERLFA